MYGEYIAVAKGHGKKGFMHSDGHILSILPKLADLGLDAINSQDYPVILGCVLVLSLAVCVINLLVDLAYAAADPRIKAQYTGGKKKKKADRNTTPVTV